MTEHGRVLDDLFGDQLRTLIIKNAEDHSALIERIAALEASVKRMAEYLGVAHVLKDPTV